MTTLAPLVDHCSKVIFHAPYTVAVEQAPLPTPAPDQLLIQTTLSAISAGTELLFYRGQVPSHMNVDASITALAAGQGIHYPLAYGYAAVGRVIAVGATLEEASWLGRRVFAFQPHASHFLAKGAELLPIPDSVSDEQAIFLPNMETAVNFVHDGAPLLGERVIVFGQGIVGLLTLHLLAHCPLAALIAVDRAESRLQRSAALGATAILTTPSATELTQLNGDLVYELTGNPAVLTDAINCTGYSGRVVIGSWYGQKRAAIDLGGHFHRNRIQLIGSQVSTIAPQLQGRWCKARRFETAWHMLESLDYTQLITHRLPVTDAAQAYQLLDQQPADLLQVVLTY
ncbi:MAG TPA: zinc-binding alcohol dehydrogenase [Caldilineaceae bacterium]|nr:zinc-binding alcohol dehydrogenase [Caldilineaceae bacterium]